MLRTQQISSTNNAGPLLTWRKHHVSLIEQTRCVSKWASWAALWHRHDPIADCCFSGHLTEATETESFPLSIFLEGADVIRPFAREPSRWASRWRVQNCASFKSKHILLGTKSTRLSIEAKRASWARCLTWHLGPKASEDKKPRVLGFVLSCPWRGKPRTF